MSRRASLNRVVLAISAFRSDDQILALLERVFAEPDLVPHRVIVVDSLGSGRLPDAISKASWPVQYLNSPVNLGSAGNLARRLELAALEDADWCFAINHDGVFDGEAVRRLVEYGEHGDRIGAVYPKRIWIDRGRTMLEPHRSVFDMPRFRRGAGASLPPTQEVAWDSSNGALYALEPIRNGLRIWADLWMGWEDLAYGWLLSREGWRQLVCPDAEYCDDYEYRRVRLLGRDLFIARKPAWYAYYTIRNLVIIVRRTRAGLRGHTFLLRRLVREFVLTLLFRTEKGTRLTFLMRGLGDGFRGVTGMMAGTRAAASSSEPGQTT